ncbi:MAG: ATP-dependent DNA helicase RecQ, partial [Microbacterium sp.]
LYDDQWAAIEALAVDRRRALVVQRTGWGKSAVYFVATALLRARGAGPTVIISPLLALMRNQIEAAERAGIRAVTINSTNIEQWQEAHADIAAGRVDVLLVSPERLNNPGFRDEVLPRLTESAGLLVIDEAHCISDWGHDFRPDYRRIRQMLTDLPEGIPVLATTATANARVTADVAEQLESRADSRDHVLVLRGELDRDSLSLGVLQLTRPEERLAWLADHLGELDGSGIIYTLTVAASAEISGFLRDRGHNVAAYSGQTDPTERQALEQDLLAGRLKALVATSALGMGFDAKLGFVINVGAPASPVAYYQQVGRAGRGLDNNARASVILLPAYEDRDIWKYFASLAFPPEQHVRTALSALQQHGGAMSTATL